MTYLPPCINAAPLSVATLTALLATPAMAELRPMDDATLGEVTGQAGVTIELETRLDIDRLSWRDEGSLNINNIGIGGQDGGPLDNLLVTVDLAGEGEVLEHGFSEIARRADAGLLDSSDPDVADALARYNQGGQFGKVFNSGDAVIHIGPNLTGDEGSLDDYLQSLDFRLTVDSVETSGSEGTTTMFSNIVMDGYVGPTDIVVRNQGDNTRTLANGNEVSESELQIDTHFEITNGQLDWDVGDVILLFNFAAVGIEGMQIHNRRGDDTEGHFGMASASASLSSGTSAASGKEGLSIHDVEFRADIDMPVFRVGGTSIGEVSFTDMAITDTTMMVYGH